MVVPAVLVEVLFCDGLCTHTVTRLFELGKTTREKGRIKIWGALSNLSQCSLGKVINNRAPLPRTVNILTVFAKPLRTSQLLLLLGGKMKQWLPKLQRTGDFFITGCHSCLLQNLDLKGQCSFSFFISVLDWIKLCNSSVLRCKGIKRIVTWAKSSVSKTDETKSR